MDRVARKAGRDVLGSDDARLNASARNGVAQAFGRSLGRIKAEELAARRAERLLHAVEAVDANGCGVAGLKPGAAGGRPPRVRRPQGALLRGEAGALALSLIAHWKIHIVSSFGRKPYRDPATAASAALSSTLGFFQLTRRAARQHKPRRENASVERPGRFCERP